MSRIAKSTAVRFESLESRQLNSAGGVDTTFGHGGLTNNALGIAAESVAVQPDGKVVISGTSGSEFAVGRFNADGSVDYTFGTNGMVRTSFGGLIGDDANRVVIQPDGKILVAGIERNGWAGGNRWALARFNANGTPDTTFGSGTGKETVGGPKDSYYVEGLAVQPDGKIVFTTRDDNVGLFSENGDFVTVRLLKDGTLDSGFGDLLHNGTRKGWVETDLGSDNDCPQGLAFGPNGTIIVAGNTGDTGYTEFGIVRYLSNGSLDSTFNNTGIKVAFAGTDADCMAVAVRSDGSILAAGTGNHEFAVVRFKSDGSADHSFGTNGYVYHKISPSLDADIATSVVMPSPDRILISGYDDAPVSDLQKYAAGDRMFTAELDLTGKLDPTFGTNGVSEIIPGGYVDEVGSALTPNGQLMVVGHFQNNSPSVLARYTVATSSPATHVKLKSVHRRA